MYNLAADDGVHVEDVLEEIRKDISASDDDLREARDRRDEVLEAAESFGVLRTFKSGSVAHLDVNNPVTDADCGVVLDRREHPSLGPDSEEEEGPAEIVTAVRDYLMPRVRESYPDARSELRKRAILIRFHEPNADGVDPSVDLAVALTRKDEPGLWIPNREKETWDASHPEEHTRLLTAKPKSLRVHRARVIRLAKAAIKQDSKQNSTPALISFNVEALALDIIEEVKGLAESLQLFFEEASLDIKEGLTEDPAGVSGKIKLPDGMTRVRSSKRLRFFADKVQEAIDNTEDRDAVEAALAELYPEQLPNARHSAKEAAADALRSADDRAVGAALGITPAATIKPVRSYGDGAPE
jgi:hypothetical protein